MGLLCRLLGHMWKKDRKIEVFLNAGATLNTGGGKTVEITRDKLTMGYVQRYRCRLCPECCIDQGELHRIMEDTVKKHIEPVAAKADETPGYIG